MKLALIASLVVAAAATASATAGSYSPPPGDHHPVWSPDGTAIVYFSRREPRGLHVMNPDGSGDKLLPLPRPGLGDPPSFAFSPDWFWIAFGSRELVVSRPDGSQRRSFGASNFATTPAWSPTGDRLVFARERDLYVVGVDGSGLRQLTRFGSEPAWSPDGELIAFRGGLPERTHILLIRPDGSGERILSLPLGSRHNRQPVWSPDGGMVAFLSDIEELTWRLTVMTREGELITQFRPEPPAASIAWSRDGRRLLLSGSGVSVVDFNGRNARLLVPFGADAVWSPTGREIAFAGVGECKDRDGIYRIDADGGGRKRLTNDCRIVGTPGPDRLQGTDVGDVVFGLDGDDFLAAYDPAFVGDDLYGGSGEDVLTGHFRGDRLEGGPGADRLEALTGPDLLRGGPGRDVLQGQGGKDQLYAEDGTRDVVSCGTNRVRGTAAELDTAFVDRLDRATGCELLYRNGRLDLTAGRTALRITSTATEYRVPQTLRCRPAGGTFPHPGAACRRLAAMRGPLAPVPYDRLCAPVAEFARAEIRGLLAGRPVVVSFNQRTTCEMERWNRHAFLVTVD